MNHKKLRPERKAAPLPTGYTQVLTTDGKVVVTHTGQPITFPIT